MKSINVLDGYKHKYMRSNKTKMGGGISIFVENDINYITRQYIKFKVFS